MSVGPRRALYGCFLLAALAAPRAAAPASQPPDLEFRTIHLEKLDIHYHRGLERLARRAGAVATEILARHEARYGQKLPHLHLVVSDTEDDPNGFASPLPFPLVHVRAVAPDGSDDFGNYDDWMRLVLTHELAHSVHLEAARGLMRVGRQVLGRAPILFPNASTPTWMIEGLATLEETEGTAFGRGRNPDVRMVLRMAALEGAFPREDQADGGRDRWPGGLAPYYFGQAFLRDLSERYGASVVPELARVHSGRVIPYLDDLTATRVTGGSFHSQWREWKERMQAAFEEEAALLEARGLTPSVPLTRRGVRQSAPRFSPDGAWIAYTDRSLTSERGIRLIHPDGTGDRRLVARNGGTTLAWEPDGTGLIYEEPEVYRTFRTRSDLRRVEIATGRRRWVTRGLRARDPDVAPDGREVVFVRQGAEGSHVAIIGIRGRGLRALTPDEPGTQWSGPRWSPDGTAIVAARWRTGGWLDLVKIDPATGETTALLEDRAKDVEPAWTPDGRHVVFRSDRDGISNLYAFRLGDGALLRVTRVLGGAFTPDVARDGRRIAFASYSSRGFDVHVAEVDLAALVGAEPFVDPYPPAPAEPPRLREADRAYRPESQLRPRFWTPYVDVTDEEAKLGAVTGGADALLRHAWGADVHFGLESGRPGVRGVYQYDRWRPTLLAAVEATTDLLDVVADDGLVERRTGRSRELQLRVSLPLRRRIRWADAVSVAWRRSHETVSAEDGRLRSRLDLGGLEASWAFSSARQYPYSISPMDGWRVRLGVLKEDPALGSDIALAKLTVDGRAYVSIRRRGDALALRAGGGTTIGRPAFRRAFTVGGFPDGGVFDVVATNPAVLRGYADDAFAGRRVLYGNAEYRHPLGHPQRGLRTLPVFVRHLHGSVFADAAHAWTGELRVRDVQTAVGAALGADLVLGHALPLTFTAGLAQGLSSQGETRAYFRAGLSF